MVSYKFPQNDTSPERAAALADLRNQYAYDDSYGIPLSTQMTKAAMSGTFLHPRMVAANAKHIAQLTKIEADILRRNTQRQPYTHWIVLLLSLKLSRV